VRSFENYARIGGGGGGRVWPKLVKIYCLTNKQLSWKNTNKQAQTSVCCGFQKKAVTNY